MGAFNAGVLGAPGPAEGSPLVQQKGSFSKLEEALSLGGILEPMLARAEGVQDTPTLSKEAFLLALVLLLFLVAPVTCLGKRDYNGPEATAQVSEERARLPCPGLGIFEARLTSFPAGAAGSFHS